MLHRSAEPFTFLCDRVIMMQEQHCLHCVHRATLLLERFAVGLVRLLQQVIPDSTAWPLGSAQCATSLICMCV